jgi:phosphotransferase system enzyme I (PtsI)
MKILEGISASPGISEGIVCLYLSETEKLLPHYSVSSEQVPNELNRLGEAFDAAKQAMERMIRVAETQFDREAAEIFNTHLSILNDEDLFTKISELIEAKKVNAEHAVSDVFEEYVKKYEDKGEHFKELIHDFVDARDRILNAFNVETGRFKCPISERQPVIVATRILTPSMVLNIPRESALAFITEEGGLTSHATILARSYGVPIILGIEVEKNLDCGMHAIADGSSGRIIVSPDKKTRERYRQKIDRLEKRKGFCEIKRSLPARTGEGKRIQLKLNINTPGEIEAAREFPHDGVGLLRTEFLFAGDTVPSEEEQYNMYRRILDGVPKRPVTVRLLDIGTDKLPLYIEAPRQINPDLGLRGAIAVETFPEIYLTQVKSLLRANVNSNLRLLYPMVSDLGDLKTFREILAGARKSLREKHIEFNDEDISEGIMIETPSAVMMAEELLEEVDFISIGSNDLLQYTLAAARGNLLVEKRYHVLHPALVKLLEIVIRAGKRAKKEVCLCGEIASFEEFYPLFLQVGLRCFSVAVSKFPDIKCELLHLQTSRDKSVVTDFYKNKSREEIDSYFMSRA